MNSLNHFNSNQKSSFYNIQTLINILLPLTNLQEDLNATKMQPKSTKHFS